MFGLTSLIAEAIKHFCCAAEPLVLLPTTNDRDTYNTSKDPASAKAPAGSLEKYLVCADLDFDVHTRWKVEALKRIYRLRGLVNNVQKTLVNTHFEVFT